MRRWDDVMNPEKHVMIPKPTRQVDKVYLAWVRTQPCVVCGARAEPHHVVTRGAGGSDYFAIPVCREHHDEFNRGGNALWGGRYGDVWRHVAETLAEYVAEMREEATGGQDA